MKRKLQIQYQKLSHNYVESMLDCWFTTWLATYTFVDYKVVSKIIYGSDKSEKINSISTILDKKNHFYLIAIKDKKVVGFCHFIDRNEYLYFHAIYVLPEFQGIGIGQEIYNRAILIAKDYKTKLIQLEVYVDNKSSISFFEKNGFCTIAKNVLAIGETNFEVCIMSNDKVLVQ